ncbi:hypothetical protein K1719_027840 [Acacia pycnantha]|nr:hypothetical protein K1719_027840 [Acacia pycnantha]
MWQMGQGSAIDVFIFRVFLYFWASKLFNTQHPLCSALFLPTHGNHLRFPSNDFECAECSSSSSSSRPETEQVKSSIKKEEPLQVICEICAESKRITEMIKNQACHHSYCSDCMTKHVATKIQDNITAVPCPGLDCKSVFEFETCRSWLPKDIIERWDKALCEALFLQVPKFYCPFKDCSAMMLVENEEDQQAGETECPVCHRMFCSRCNIPWHVGVNCKKYQKLNENERQREDLLMRKLAKEKRWRRCPKCVNMSFVMHVEKSGILHADVVKEIRSNAKV